MNPLNRVIFLLFAFTSLAAWAGDGDSSMFDRVITIVSSVVVPIVLALLGHYLGQQRTTKEEEKVRQKSGIFKPPAPAAPKTALNWLAEVGNVAAPVSQLVAPSPTRRAWMPFAVAFVLVVVGIGTGVVVSRLVGGPSQPVAATSPAAAVPAPAMAAAPAAVQGESFKTFVDRGDTFVRAGSAEGLAVGSTVALLDGSGSTVGEGKVAEVFEHLARLRLDEGAKAAAGGTLVASFVPNRAAAAEAPVAAPVAKRPKGPVAAPTPVAVAPVAAPRGMTGDARIGGFGPAKRLTIRNTGSAGWSRCELRLPTNKRFLLDVLPAGGSDGIMLAKFNLDGPEKDEELTWLNVTCAEGSVRLNLH